MIKKKKGVLGPVISVFVMVLVVSILAGLTFLFISQLKTQVEDTTATTAITQTDSGGWINSSGYTLTGASALGAHNFVIVTAYNATGTYVITSGNYTVSSTGVVTNATAANWALNNITYNYEYIGEDSAFVAVNETEAAGATVVNYLSLIFLAVIFGAILTLVLRIILPYINIGREMGGF